MLFLVRARSCSRRFLLRGRWPWCLRLFLLSWSLRVCGFSSQIRGYSLGTGLFGDGSGRSWSCGTEGVGRRIEEILLS